MHIFCILYCALELLNFLWKYTGIFTNIDWFNLIFIHKYPCKSLWMRAQLLSHSEGHWDVKKMHTYSYTLLSLYTVTHTHIGQLITANILKLIFCITLAHSVFQPFYVYPNMWSNRFNHINKFKKFFSLQWLHVGTRCRHILVLIFMYVISHLCTHSILLSHHPQ